MNLHQLKVFQEVVRQKSFTRAAQALHLTQPAVSAQIRRLEESLQLTLLDRIGKRTTPTEAGLVLAQRTERILVQLEQAQEDLNSFRNLQRGTLHIGASTTPGVYILPRVVAAYRVSYPGIHIELTLSNTHDVSQSVARNELDLGFVGGGGPTLQDLAVESFMRDELVLIAPPDHPLTLCDRPLSPPEICGSAFVAREAGSATWQCFDEWLRGQGLTIEPILRLSSVEAAKRAVAGGLGLSIASRFAVELELRCGVLAVLEVDDFPLTRELAVVRHTDRSLSAAATAFIEMAGMGCPLRAP